MNIPYPNNNTNYDIKTPTYIQNNITNQDSRYYIYRKIDNYSMHPLEIKLTNSISRNETYLGYYYTTQENETLQQISKKYYKDESLWWVIAKANNIKNKAILQKDVTIVIPAMSELTANGGYFNAI